MILNSINFLFPQQYWLAPDPQCTLFWSKEDKIKQRWFCSFFNMDEQAILMILSLLFEYYDKNKLIFYLIYISCLYILHQIKVNLLCLCVILIILNKMPLNLNVKINPKIDLSQFQNILFLSVLLINDVFIVVFSLFLPILLFEDVYIFITHG